jgi:uncharacterized protein (TIGR02118 family)
MYRLTASYAHPADHDAFVEHYRDIHAKLGAQLPGVRAFSWGVCETPDGTKPAHALVAVLDWDTKEAALAAFESPAGKEAVADLANFAQAGVDLEFQELRTEV